MISPSNSVPQSITAPPGRDFVSCLRMYELTGWSQALKTKYKKILNSDIILLRYLWHILAIVNIYITLEVMVQQYFKTQ